MDKGVPKHDSNDRTPDKLGAPPEQAGALGANRTQGARAWANLIAKKPRAAMLLHHLVAQMGHQNAVVVSQKTLAKLMGIHERTVRRAVADLVEDRWIAVIRIGSGKEAAYVVNDRVAWVSPRPVAAVGVLGHGRGRHRDQDPATLAHADLRRIPTLYPGERQLPTGPGEPPSQPIFEGMDPDLPTISHARVDPETGELVGRFSDPNFGVAALTEAEQRAARPAAATDGRRTGLPGRRRAVRRSADPHHTGEEGEL